MAIQTYRGFTIKTRRSGGGTEFEVLQNGVIQAGGAHPDKDDAIRWAKSLIDQKIGGKTGQDLLQAASAGFRPQ